MKKILVPCDFSGPAIQAFKFASQLASVSKGEIYLLNVMEMPVLHSSLFAPVAAYEKSFLKDIRAKANKNFEKLVDRYAKKLRVQLFVERGTVAEMVNKFIARKKIDLVIMGTHGTSGFREFAIGSNTEKVVRSCKVPMMAVRIAPKKAAFENIVFPTNLKLEQKKTVESIKALQNFFKAKLHILYVNDPTNFTRDIFIEPKLNEYARQNQFKNYQIHIYNDIDTESGIINFSSRFKSKLIAMATHGRTGLSHLVSGSVAEDVVNHLDCPIWTTAQ